MIVPLSNLIKSQSANLLQKHKSQPELEGKAYIGQGPTELWKARELSF